MKKSTRIAGLVLVGLLLLSTWYAVASNYDYNVLAGRYAWNEGPASCLLTLRANGTFHQELMQDGQLAEADGTWHRIGTSGVHFSSQFIRVAGAKNFVEVHGPVGDGSEADRQFYGHFVKTLGLFPVLHLEDEDSAPTFHRHLLH